MITRRGKDMFCFLILILILIEKIHSHPHIQTQQPNMYQTFYPSLSHRVMVIYSYLHPYMFSYCFNIN